MKLTPVERGRFVSRIGESEIVEFDRAPELRTQAARGRVDLQRPIEHVARLADRGAHFLVILDQSGQAHERLRHAPAQHHEGEQAADHVAGGVVHREIGADHHRAQTHHALDRRDQGLRPVGELAEVELALASFRDALVPLRAPLRLERERLDRADADDASRSIVADFALSATLTRVIENLQRPAGTPG